NTPTRFGVGRNVSRNGASVRNFTVNLAQDRDTFSVNVSTSEDPPETAPPVETGTPFTYVDVDAGNLTDEDYNSVEWDFTVDPERLEENDVDPENVQLQRYNETRGAWERFETTHRGNGEFVAEVPGFS
ncbi:PGF-pre-PGF domain-containing protein, partial [Halorubrum sp. SP3]